MEYGSQLLGWPDVIQYSMFAECELVTQGYYLGSGWHKVPKDVRKRQKKQHVTNGDYFCSLTLWNAVISI